MSIRCTSKAIIIKDGCVLFNRDRREDGSVYFDLPGGGQHKYETMEDALIREVKEETGYEVRVLRLAAVVEMINTDEEIRVRFSEYAHRMLHIFLAELTDAEQEEPSERDFGMEASEWVPIDEVRTLPETCPLGLKEALPEILKADGAVYLGAEYLNW